MMYAHTLNIDLETYSEVDITSVGMHRYVDDPSFEILLCAYSLDGSPVTVVDLANGEELPVVFLTALCAHDCEKRAYNALFEYTCLRKHCRTLSLDISDWRCTQFRAVYAGYPAPLAAAGPALGLSEDKLKMSEGRALIRLFCTPRTPSARDPRTRIYPQHEPEKWELFKQYNRRDVETEMAVYNALSDIVIPDSEQKLWELDAEINETGIRIDTGLVAGAIRISETETERLLGEAAELTGLSNPNSVSQLKGWLTDEGEEVDKLDKEALKRLLGDSDSDTVRRVCEIRSSLGKASVKKYSAMQNAVCSDGRIRGSLRFYGARTGRWAGSVLQPQNFTKNHFKTDELMDLARDITRSGDADTLGLVFGDAQDTLSQLTRTALVPSEGRRFAVADFSAIEARVLAWLAGEKWVNEVFATHGRIYEATAAQMFGVPIERIAKGNPEYELRQKGKVATLALGYGGSAGALIAMGALKQGLTEDELPGLVRLWRDANPNIVKLWRAVENAALAAVRTKKPTFVRTDSTTLAFGMKGRMPVSENDVGREALTILLPSGRELYYVEPKIEKNRFGRDALTYMGRSTAGLWVRNETFGGKLVENVVQALARDCLALTLTRLHDLGYSTVFHVHDEVIVDLDGPDTELDNILDVMRQPVPWADGLILKGAGFVADYYQKD